MKMGEFVFPGAFFYDAFIDTDKGLLGLKEVRCGGVFGRFCYFFL